MEKSSIIIKKDDTNFCYQNQKDSLIILVDENEKVCVLNETSKFLYENCVDKTVEQLSLILYEQILDKESIKFETILEDCIEALSYMQEANLIEIK